MKPTSSTDSEYVDFSSNHARSARYADFKFTFASACFERTPNLRKLGTAISATLPKQQTNARPPTTSSTISTALLFFGCPPFPCGVMEAPYQAPVRNSAAAVERQHNNENAPTISTHTSPPRERSSCS